MYSRHARGLTLVEVLVATVLTGVAVLGSLGMLNQAQAVTSQVERDTNTAKRKQSAIERLRSLVLQLSVSKDTTASLVGTEASADFESRCLVPRGWAQACRVSVRIEDSAGTNHLHIVTNSHGQWDVFEDASALRLLFLEAAEGSGRWRSSWLETHAVPLGFGVIRARAEMIDTVFFRIGRRE